MKLWQLALGTAVLGAILFAAVVEPTLLSVVLGAIGGALTGAVIHRLYGATPAEDRPHGRADMHSVTSLRKARRIALRCLVGYLAFVLLMVASVWVLWDELPSAFGVLGLLVPACILLAWYAIIVWHERLG